MEESSDSGRCTTFLYFTWKIFTCLFTHIMLVTMVVAYCILGAATFESLERENEIFVKTNITYMRNNVTEDLWSFTKEMSVLHQENWTENAMKRIKAFETDLVLAMRKSGWDGSEETDSLQWTFTGALFYSIIVITTIGYGHIAPKTHLGKVTTIFYAIVGIPLMLLCLSNIGDIMAHSFRFLYWRICCYACTREPKRGGSTRRRYRPNSRPPSNGGRGSLRVSAQRSATSLSDTETRYMSRENDARINTLSLPDTVHMDRSKQRGVGEEEPSNTPILFNKYALDPEDYYKGREVESRDSVLSSSSNEGKWAKRNAPMAEQKQRSTEYSGLRRTQEMSPSPRIMSPMGFIVPRSTPTEYYSSNYSDYGDDTGTNQTKPVPIWLCVFLVVSYIVGGAFLFAGWEDWGYADSAYFCFITLTTIGFGDFVPAQRVNKKNGEMSIALCSLYLLFGIALLAMSFNLVQEEVISNVKAVARHLGIIKDTGNDSGPEYGGE